MLSIAQDIQDQIAPYQSAINVSLDVATALPLIGNQLDSLQQLSTVLQNSLASIQSQTQHITTSGHYQIAIALPTISHTFAFDLGLDALLQVSTAGGVAATLTPVLNVGFDYDGNDATLDTSNTNLDLGFSLSLPNFQATASLNGLLHTHMADASLSNQPGTSFTGNLKFEFDDNNEVNAEFSGDAHVRLDMAISFIDPALNASFNPTFHTQFQVDWGIDTGSNQLETPYIAFKNFSLDVDSFMDSFLGDIVTTAQKYTKPLQPFIDMFETPVPILSAFDSSETVGDLLLKGASLNEAQRDRFELMVQIIKTVNTIDLSGSTGGAVLNFGDVELTGEQLDASGNLLGTFGFDTTQLSGVIDDIFNSPVLGDVKDALQSVARYTGVTSTAGFQFPVLENPGPVIGGILTGQVRDMFTFTTGRQHFEVAPSIGVGIEGVLGVFLSAGVIFDASFSMGYDTAGLIKLAQAPQSGPQALLHGFYFDNSVDTTAPPIPNVPAPKKTGLYLQGFAQLSGSAVITLSGGLYANINVELASPNHGSHVYLDDLITNLSSPAKIFNLSGQVYAAATAELTLPNPVGPDITLFSYELAKDVILDFNPPPQPSESKPLTVIDVTNQHTLLLDPAKIGFRGAVSVRAFHDYNVGGYLADGIRVDYANEIVLYVERKNNITTNYYNLIGINGTAPDGASILVVDPFRVFADEGVVNPAPSQTAHGVIFVGGKNVNYKYVETADGSEATVLLVGGHGSTTLTGGTMSFGNFIPADRINQAKQHFGNTTGFDAAGSTLINSAIDAGVAPVSPAGIIGSTISASRGGLMIGGAGANSFIATGAGVYEMIGSTWVDTFNISPSFGGVAATYSIDAGGGPNDSMVVRVPKEDSVTFENASITDKYLPEYKALAVHANAGLSATAHGLRKVKIVATRGSTVMLGDTSELNIDFSIVGGANLIFGGTNAPDDFTVTTDGPFHGLLNHYGPPRVTIYYEEGYPDYPVYSDWGNLDPWPDPVYYVTRTFGTNGRTQTIPFVISDPSGSSVELNAGGASDNYTINVGVGAFVDIHVSDSDGSTENQLTTVTNDDRLVFHGLKLTDSGVEFDYYTTAYLWSYGISYVYGTFNTSVHYTPKVTFAGDIDVTVQTAIAFDHVTVDRPNATHSVTLFVGGTVVSPAIPYAGNDGRLGIWDVTVNPEFYLPTQNNPTRFARTIQILANAGSLAIKYPQHTYALTFDVHSNTGNLLLETGRTFDPWSLTTFNIHSNSGTVTVNPIINAGAAHGTQHVVNILDSTGTINLHGERNIALTQTSYDTIVNIGSDGSGNGSLDNIQGTINFLPSSQLVSTYLIKLDDRAGSAPPGQWIVSSSQVKTGGLTINGLKENTWWPTAMETYWRAGTQVVKEGEPPLPTSYNFRWNGSQEFPLRWIAPFSILGYDMEEVDQSIAQFAGPPPSSVTYTATGLPPGVSLNSSTGQLTGTIPLGTSENFSYWVQFTVSDGTYTVKQTALYIVIPTSSVSLGFDETIDIDEGAEVYLYFYVDSMLGLPMEVTVTGLPSWLTYDPEEYTFTGTAPVGTAAEGPYHVVIEGTDGVSTSTVSFDILVAGTTFNVATPLQAGVIGDSVDVTVNATTTSGRPLTYSAEDLPEGLSIDPQTGRITGTLSGSITQSQVYYATIAAYDGAATRETSLVWNVIPADTEDVLKLSSPGPLTNKAGEFAVATVPGMSSQFLNLHYTISGMPNATIFSGTIYVYPTEYSSTPYQVTVTATNGFTTEEVTFEWRVTGTQPITINSVPAITTGAGSFANVPIEVTNTAGLPLTFSATGLPAGVSINAQTGAITGTLSTLSAYPSVHLPTVTVTNGSYTTSLQFKWTVNGSNFPGNVPLPMPGGGILRLMGTNLEIAASITGTPAQGLPGGGITFPYGFVDFDLTPTTATAIPAGGSTTLAINVPALTLDTKFYAYGPTPDNATSHWYDFTYDTATGTGVKIVGSDLVLHFVDGGRGDHDLTKNGMIVHAGGITAAEPAPPLPGDYDYNGAVDAADYTIWRDQLGQTGLELFSGADGNGNGTIDSGDWEVWRDNFGRTLPDAGAGAAAAAFAELAFEADESLVSSPVETTAPARLVEVDALRNNLDSLLLTARSTRPASASRSGTWTGSSRAIPSTSDSLLLVLATDRVSASSQREFTEADPSESEDHRDDYFSDEECLVSNRARINSAFAFRTARSN